MICFYQFGGAMMFDGKIEANIANDVNIDYNSRFKRNFEIVQRLGKGGYGVVFEVKSRDGRKYAIKRIDLTKQPRNLIERETKFKDYQHPNIVKYFDSWIETPPANWQENEDKIWMECLNLFPIALPLQGYCPEIKNDTECAEAVYGVSTTIPSEFLYIQMELCENDNLADWLLKSNPTIRKDQYLSIFRQIVKAVKFINEKNVIYRDLKPENIFFGFDGQIKIGDFGTCTDHESQVSPCRNHKKHNNHPVLHTAGIGTDSYKAPELEGGRNYDSKVDIFSLGVILYELITPFHAPSERCIAIDRLRNTPFPKDFDPNFKKEFELVKKMLSKNPKKRPTIYLVEEHMNNWGDMPHSDAESPWKVPYIDFFSLFTSILRHYDIEHGPVRAHSDYKEKIVSKNRPLKMKKDNRILQ